MTTNNATNNYANGIKVTRFTSSDTWTKDADAVYIKVVGWSGGSGGGSGRRGAAASERGGGSGGCMSGSFLYEGDAGNFDTTESVTIGAGATGGAAQTVDDTDGSNGGDAGISSFGDLEINGFFTRGEGGGTTQKNGGASSKIATATFYSKTYDGSVTDGGYGRVTAGGDGVDQPKEDVFGGNLGVGSAGGGGGVNSSNVAANGGRGGNVRTINGGSTVLAGGTAGAASGGAGGAGNAGGTSVTTGGFMCCGTGGGGGAGNEAGAGGDGGDGAIPGGAGGGGGASVNGSNSGAGGDGARGEVWVYEYLGQ